MMFLTQWNNNLYKNKFDDFFKNKLINNHISQIILVNDNDFNFNNFLWIKDCLIFTKENKENGVKIFSLKKNCLN